MSKPNRTSRRGFLGGTLGAGVAGVAAGCGGPLGVGAAPAPGPKAKKAPPGMAIGFHTDAFNTSYRNFEACLHGAQKNRCCCGGRWRNTACASRRSTRPSR